MVSELVVFFNLFACILEFHRILTATVLDFSLFNQIFRYDYLVAG